MTSTTTLNGRLLRVDFGTGAWVLDQPDGQRWELHGSVPARLEGREVRVRGRAVERFSLAMAGPAFEVVAVEEG